MQQIFLGGTCGSNNWREEIVIPRLLELGVSPESIFNPVVKHWDAEAQAREDEAKRTAAIQLYVIASPDPTTQTANVSAYSLVELTMGLYDNPGSIVAMFDTTGMPKHTAKAISKASQDLQTRFPNAPIYTNNYDSACQWIADELAY
jgi:Nucleoside 2-deoxyribosyltransferase like